jgi:Zn-dependent protease
MDDLVTPPPGTPPPPPARRRSGIPLGRVAGFPVVLSYSWLILAALITYVYGGYVKNSRPDLPVSTAYLIGFSMVIFLLVSVLLHEMGHAVTARWFGIGVRGITLELVGGYTEMEQESPTPKVEAIVSLTGPAVSFALGLGAAGLTALLPRGDLLWQLAFQMALGNLAVAVFNVLPGLPLDGGRALRAGIWAVTRNRPLGDRVAGWTGRIVAVASLGTVLALLYAGLITFYGVAFTAVIALTLWNGAGQAIRLGRMGDRLPMINAGQLARPLIPVTTGTPLSEAWRQYEEMSRAVPPERPGVLAVVDSAGHLLSVLNDVAAAAVPAERRPWVAVDTVSRAIEPGRVIPAELSGLDVVQAVQANPASEYVVTVGEDVVGVLRVADLMRMLEPSTGR